MLIKLPCLISDREPRTFVSSISPDIITLIPVTPKKTSKNDLTWANSTENRRSHFLAKFWESWKPVGKKNLLSSWVLSRCSTSFFAPWAKIIRILEGIYCQTRNPYLIFLPTRDPKLKRSNPIPETRTRRFFVFGYWYAGSGN